MGSEGTFGSLLPGTALVMGRKEQNPKQLLLRAVCEPRRLLQSWDGVLGVCVVQSVEQDWHLAEREAGCPALGSPQVQL